MSGQQLHGSRSAAAVRHASAYVAALAAPLALNALVYLFAEWPKPYSWQYLGVSLAIAIVFGTGPGVVALAVAALSVLWLGVPTPVHPGVEMFVIVDSGLLLLLHETRRSRQHAAAVIKRLNADLERRNAELEAERARWKNVLEGIADEVWVCDAQGRMELMNLAAVTPLGLEDFKDKSVEQVLEAVEILGADGRVRPAADAPLLRALSGATVHGEELMRHRASGVTGWRQFSAAPVRDTTGTIVGSVAVVRDVTDYRRMDRELREANARLAEADRRKDEYLSMLSHELRNPLAAVSWAVSLIARHPAGQGELKRVAETASRQAANMARMLDDLLDVARITRGQISLHPKAVDLASVVSGAIETVKPKIDARGHRLAVAVPADPLLVHADAVRLSQVVANLLDNAARYTEANGEIRIRAAREGGDAVIRVADTGRGIPAELLPRVFQPLERREVSAGNSEGGLGLGLALAQRLVELHGGRMEAHSDGPGKGSEFLVRLPALAAGANTTENVPSTEGRLEANRRVLVVDDNVDCADMLATGLRMAGYAVRTAYSGQEALHAAEQYDPNVVILDLGMSDLNGYQVAERLRQLPGLEETPIIAVTGYGDSGHHERTLAAGFSAHLVKPVELDSLRRALDEVRAPRPAGQQTTRRPSPPLVE